MLENGAIVEMGTYEELKGLNGAFALFIKAYLENQEKTVESKLVEISELEDDNFT